jgi:AcrR family transcriptional regulator
MKKPKQARAMVTVKLIFESTAQIILREGIEKLTTNRIAEVAGVSVGTLYQYFKNKESILLAMVSHEKDGLITELDAFFLQAAELPIEQIISSLVDFLLLRFFQRRKEAVLLMSCSSSSSCFRSSL